jgi:PAS domain S-box-containing protein
MYASPAVVEQMLRDAIAAAERDEAELRSTLESLDAPIYLTDHNGVVTHFNRACVGFAGRTPTAGKDHWCVTWKLYTDEGEFLPHDECPMALAIRDRRPIRGLTAVAERPDGARVRFIAFPTPILAADGGLLGAINVLIDVSDERQIADLRAQAAKCRRLLKALTDAQTRKALAALAAECEAKALELQHPSVTTQ